MSIGSPVIRRRSFVIRRCGLEKLHGDERQAQPVELIEQPEQLGLIQHGSRQDGEPYRPSRQLIGPHHVT
jgi:hypothetical protein